MTGGNIAVLDLGSTGCSIVCSFSPSAERDEFDRNLLAIVFWVSALWSGFAKREDTLPLCLTDIYSQVRIYVEWYETEVTHCFRSMQHSHTKIPQKQPAILTNTSKSIISIIAPPWVKANGCDPRLMTLTSCDDCCLGYRPYRNEIVLPSCKHILAVRRPTDT
jgi:hypothetical protein